MLRTFQTNYIHDYKRFFGEAGSGGATCEVNLRERGLPAALVARQRAVAQWFEAEYEKGEALAENQKG